MPAPHSPLALRSSAVALLTRWRESTPPPAIDGDLSHRLRRLVEAIDRAVTRAEAQSAAAHPDGASREADVARRLGVDPSALRSYRAVVREERAARE